MIAATLTIIAVVVLPSLVVAPYDVARHDGSVRRKPIRYIGVSTLDGEQPLEMENIISPMNTGLHTEATDKNGLPILSSQGTRLLRRPQTRSSRELANEDRTTASAIEANIKCVFVSPRLMSTHYVWTASRVNYSSFLNRNLRYLEE
eukprot:Lankesteria_metandrocarpae@DN2645_c0_g1_i2.p1